MEFTQPTPERKESLERRGVFDLNKLTNDEVVALGEALMSLAYASEGESELERLLLNDLGDLAGSDPDRSEELLLAFKEKGSDEALEMAAMHALVVAERNYSLASSVLLDIEFNSETEASETAMAVRLDLEKQLPPEQAVDLRARHRCLEKQHGHQFH